MSGSPFRPVSVLAGDQTIAEFMERVDYKTGDALDFAYADAARALYRIAPHDRFERSLDACLLGAVLGTRAFLGDPNFNRVGLQETVVQPPRDWFKVGWPHGLDWSETGAEEAQDLLEVWATTLAAYMLRDWPEREPLTDRIVLDFSNALGTDLQIAVREFRVFELILDRDNPKPQPRELAVLLLRLCRSARMRVFDFTEKPLRSLDPEDVIDWRLVADTGVFVHLRTHLRNARRLADMAFDQLEAESADS